jgi:hypothetical protein
MGTEEETKELEKREAGSAMETTGKDESQRPDEKRRTETITEARRAERIEHKMRQKQGKLQQRSGGVKN